MISKKYLFFGRVDAVVQAAPGAGIVSSFTLQSDDLDEIDWEWIGNDAAQAQSNYFGKGDTSTYDRGAYHPADAVTSGFHTYSIEWTAEKIDWIIDDVVVRTLHYADAQGGERFPQTPMQVRLGTWVGGQEGNSDGTIQWAGGLADFSNAPFVAYYKSLTITDYANGVDGAKEYAYKDSSGSYQSIEVVTTAASDKEDEDDGDGDDADDDNDDENDNENSNNSNTKTKLTATETASDGEDETGTSTANDKDDNDHDDDDDESPSTTSDGATTLITATAITGGSEDVPSETAVATLTPASNAASVAAVAQAVLVAGAALAAALVLS